MSIRPMQGGAQPRLPVNFGLNLGIGHSQAGSTVSATKQALLYAGETT
jgi:hypothetical protein